MVTQLFCRCGSTRHGVNKHLWVDYQKAKWVFVRALSANVRMQMHKCHDGSGTPDYNPSLMGRNTSTTRCVQTHDVPYQVVMRVGLLRTELLRAILH